MKDEGGCRKVVLVLVLGGERRRVPSRVRYRPSRTPRTRTSTREARLLPGPPPAPPLEGSEDDTENEIPLSRNVGAGGPHGSWRDHPFSLPNQRNWRQ